MKVIGPHQAMPFCSKTAGAAQLKPKPALPGSECLISQCNAAPQRKHVLSHASHAQIAALLAYATPFCSTEKDGSGLPARTRACSALRLSATVVC